jgi:hypothetical protein
VESDCFDHDTSPPAFFYDKEHIHSLNASSKTQNVLQLNCSLYQYFIVQGTAFPSFMSSHAINLVDVCPSGNLVWRHLRAHGVLRCFRPRSFFPSPPPCLVRPRGVASQVIEGRLFHHQDAAFGGRGKDGFHPTVGGRLELEPPTQARFFAQTQDTIQGFHRRPRQVLRGGARLGEIAKPRGNLLRRHAHAEAGVAGKGAAILAQNVVIRAHVVGGHFLHDLPSIDKDLDLPIDSHGAILGGLIGRGHGGTSLGYRDPRPAHQGPVTEINRRAVLVARTETGIAGKDSRLVGHRSGSKGVLDAINFHPHVVGPRSEGVQGRVHVGKALADLHDATKGRQHHEGILFDQIVHVQENVIRGGGTAAAAALVGVAGEGVDRRRGGDELHCVIVVISAVVVLQIVVFLVPVGVRKEGSRRGGAGAFIPRLLNPALHARAVTQTVAQTHPRAASGGRNGGAGLPGRRHGILHGGDRAQEGGRVAAERLLASRMDIRRGFRHAVRLSIDFVGQVNEIERLVSVQGERRRGRGAQGSVTEGVISGRVAAPFQAGLRGRRCGERACPGGALVVRGSHLVVRGNELS